MSDKKLVNKKNKLLKRLMIFFGALLILSLLGGFSAPLILKKVMVSELRKLGFDDAVVKSAYLTPAGFDIQGIILTSDMRNKIGYLRIETTLGNIVKGRANNIIIDRVSVDFDVLQTIVSKSQSADLSPLKGDTAFSLPFDRLWLRHSELVLRDLEGAETKLVVKGRFEENRQGGAMDLNATYALMHSKFDLSGIIKGKMEGFDQFDIKVDLDKFVSKDEQYQAKRFSGYLSIGQEKNKDITYLGKMDAGHLQLGDLPLQTVQMQFFADLGKKVSFVVNGKMPNNAASFSIDAQGSDINNIEAAAHVKLHDLSKLQYIKGDWRALTKMSGKGEISANISAVAASKQAADHAGIGLNMASSFNLYDLSYGQTVKHAQISGKIYKTEDEDYVSLALSPNSFVNSHDAMIKFDTGEDITARLTLKPAQNMGFDIALNGVDVKVDDIALKMPQQMKLTGDYQYLESNLSNLNADYHGSTYIHYGDTLKINTEKSNLKVTQRNGLSFQVMYKISRMAAYYKKQQLTPLLYGRISGNIGTDQQKLKAQFDDGLGNFVVKADLDKIGNDFGLRASLHPLTFDHDLYALKDAFPFTDKWAIGNETGVIGAKLDIRRNKGKWQKQFAEILIKDFGFDTALAGMRGVSTVLSTQQLFPLKLQNQSLFVGGTDYVAPLQHLFLQYGYDQSKNTLSVDDFSMQFAEGVVKINKQNIDFNKDKQLIEFNAKNVDLLTLFNHTNLKGIDASGQLDGHAKLEILKQTPYMRIVDGELKSLRQGHFKYAPADMPDFLRNPSNVGLIQLKQALNNFHYDEITLSLDMADQKSQQIQLKAIGKNPDFYNGKPVHINLNLEGQVENVLKQNLQTYQIPDQIKDKLEAYQNNAH